MADREKQITELANEIARFCPDKVEDGCGVCNCASCIAVGIVDAGYHKTEQQWIPVTERLPEKEGRYLCTLPIGKSGAVYVQIMNGDRHGFSLGHIYNDDATHWMPLPKPPKGE